MGMRTQRLRHFLLLQIKHSPLAPKIVSGRGWLRKQDRRRRRQPINAFLANGGNLERPFLFVTHYKPPPCRPTCHYPGQAETIGGISGCDLLSERAGERTMDNRDIYTDL